MSALNRLQKVEAVIITHREYGEADRILKAITFELGKISILAKGVRKASSRKAPHIEPFTHSSLMLAKGPKFLDPNPSRFHRPISGDQREILTVPDWLHICWNYLID